jgi:hypothetical protein
LKTRLFICKRVADDLKITSHIWGKFKKVTRRGEVRLLRTVKNNRGKVLREITDDFNEGGVVRVYPKTIQRYLHKN